jgi:general secretion pathway protein D
VKDFADSSLMRFVRLVPLPLRTLLLCLPLLNCAGTPATRECASIVAQDKVQQSLPRLRQLASQEPAGGACGRAYALASERVVAVTLREAERMRSDANVPQATRLYREVLDAQPGNAIAEQGLRTIEREQRLHRLLADARNAIGAGDWIQSQALLEAALGAAPGNAEATTLLREVSQRTAPAAPEPGLMAAFKKPISLEFKDVALRQIFEVLSQNSGLNFVFDKDVKIDQKTSIFLRDSTVESALFFLLLTNQLEQQVMNGNTVLIYPNVPGKLKDYQELHVRTFQMANTDVKAVAASLKTLFKGRDVVVDEKLNMLVVRDTPEAIRLVEKLVALHDIAEPEVMLEVAVLEVSRKKLLNLGVNLPNSLTLTPLATNTYTGLTLNDLRGVNGDSIGAAVGSIGINLQKEDADTAILANPRIRVVNREKAKVLIGERVPVITVTTSPTGGYGESVNYVEVGLKLEVEPTIYRGNEIVIKVGLEVSNISGTAPSKSGGLTYTFGTRTANTTLRLRDGENQILAGLISDEDRKIASKVPGIGDLPLVGRLFGTEQDSGNKSEIVLSITPRLVRNSNRSESTALEFRSGTENSLRERPLIAGRTRVPAPVAQAGAVAPVSPQPATPVTAVQAPTQATAATPVPPTIAPPTSSPTTPSAAPQVAPKAAIPVERPVPAVVGMPVVSINNGSFSQSPASLAGKATGIRTDDGSDAK